MKSRVILIFALFLTLTSFRSDEKAVKQSDSKILSSAYAVPERPEFLRPLKGPIFVKEGRSMSLEVTFTGNPQCRVRWFKNGKEIQSGGRYEIIVDGKFGVSILYVKVMYLEDAGDYSVQIENLVGQARSTARVYVEEAPVR